MLRRIRIYGVGFFLGCLLSYFFLFKNRDHNLDYWLPKERIRDEIISKKHFFDGSFSCAQQCLNINSDTASIEILVKTSDIDFSKSQTKIAQKTYYFEQEAFSFQAQMGEVITFKNLRAKKDEKCLCK